MDELLLPPTDLSTRNFISGIVYLSCVLIRSLTAQLAQASVTGFQLDPTGGTSIALIARLLAVIASHPLDASHPLADMYSTIATVRDAAC